MKKKKENWFSLLISFNELQISKIHLLGKVIKAVFQSHYEYIKKTKTRWWNKESANYKMLSACIPPIKMLFKIREHKLKILYISPVQRDHRKHTSKYHIIEIKLIRKEDFRLCPWLVTILEIFYFWLHTFTEK